MGIASSMTAMLRVELRGPAPRRGEPPDDQRKRGAEELVRVDGRQAHGGRTDLEAKAHAAERSTVCGSSRPAGLEPDEDAAYHGSRDPRGEDTIAYISILDRRVFSGVVGADADVAGGDQDGAASRDACAAHEHGEAGSA